MTLFCATTNPGKLREFNLISGDIKVLPVPGLADIAPPEETGATFAENASIKAAYYSGFVDGVVFADDSGLAVDALGGAPGVYSARFAGEDATDERNNARVLAAMDGQTNRRARFVCVIAVAARRHPLMMFEGFVEGELLTAPRGANGFGYDPLFYYSPFGCTFAEATAEQKFGVSHRGQALAKMMAARWSGDFLFR
ncbi:MAG: RdgB/HAM1 family non-canonical purine NTP pyrophosphatase [Bryobacterales bacterium]|nr:RdgB/HAM1 family non-canonical purine NTP pyrophosphatase [Bryobacterales bacterium]